MKKLFFAAVLTLVSASAFASKARLTALGGAAHISDAQTFTTQPADIHEVPDYVTLEFGETVSSTATATDNTADAAGNPNAEGGFVKSMGESKFGVYLGRQSESMALRQAFNAATGGTVPTMENPIELMYGAKTGDIKWGASFVYSNSDDKDANTKQSAMGARFGARKDAWDASIILGLGSNAEDATHKYKGTTGIKVTGGYSLNDNTYLFGSYKMDGFKGELSGNEVTDTSVNELALGFVNSWKVDGGSFFYGATLVQYNQDDKKTTADDKVTEMTLPFLIGVEADASSWLVLRGSVTQNVLISSEKDSGVDNGTVANSTTVAAGAGIKFNKMMLDMTLTSASNGALGSDDIGGNAALTYTF